ncbi:MAG: 4-hydroxy-tetrahydrodipicolinate reductase [Candidatus Fermentibacteraceae bacterium]
MRYAVFGAMGRMGSSVIREAQRLSLELTAALDRGSDMKIPEGTDVLLDFSAPSAWDDLDKTISGSPAALVSGTTGLDDACRAMLERWSRERPVFYSSNMSTGVFVLNRLVRQARAMLGEGFDVELVEIHHRNKVDSPSGTAVALLEGSPGALVFGRHGITGIRSNDEVGVHSLRGGDVLGEHQVHLLGQGERLCLTHMTTDRRVLALGALRAARFAAGMAPGLYGMEDMLGHGS